MIRRSRPLAAALVALSVLAAGLWPGIAAAADTIERFRPTQDGSGRLDHDRWDRFLDRFVVTDAPGGIHLVRYGAVDGAARAELDGYLGALQATDPLTLTRDGQMAYWINLYNALTVALILDADDIDSIRDIGGLFSPGPWSRELATVNGRALTLDDIEHGILRPLFTDPRIHFAVNCASLGCPDLLAEAFTAANLEDLLDAGARAYVNHPRGARFEDGRLHLSSIFDWYRSDFPADRAAFMNWLARYADPALAERLRGYDGRIRHSYDWGLNDAG